MFYMVSKSTNLKDVSLRFFETNRGQNEGDSAHSAIVHALKHAGNLFLPSQVATVITLGGGQSVKMFALQQDGPRFDPCQVHTLKPAL